MTPVTVSILYKKRIKERQHYIKKILLSSLIFIKQQIPH